MLFAIGFVVAADQFIFNEGWGAFREVAEEHSRIDIYRCIFNLASVDIVPASNPWRKCRL